MGVEIGDCGVEFRLVLSGQADEERADRLTLDRIHAAVDQLRCHAGGSGNIVEESAFCGCA